MSTDKVKERWRGIIMFVTSSIEQQADAANEEEANQINTEMYNWLTENFTLTVKKRKPPPLTIFDLMKKPNQSKTQS